jgi:hypothetical protein
MCEKTNLDYLALYAEALAELRKAEEALDQAHAMLKDLNLDCYIEAGPRMRSGRMTVADTYSVVAGLAKDLETVACPECGNDMSANVACLSGRCLSLDKE